MRLPADVELRINMCQNERKLNRKCEKKPHYTMLLGRTIEIKNKNKNEPIFVKA